MEPLVQPAVVCLNLRHCLYLLTPCLFTDAPDLLFNFLREEINPTCVHNGFAASVSRSKAVEHLGRVSGTAIHAIVLFSSCCRKSLIAHQVFRNHVYSLQTSNSFAPTISTAPPIKLHICVVFDLLEATSSAVVYEAVTTLVALSNDPDTCLIAVGKLVGHAVKESDNNVKFIILDKVDRLR
jgi:coatomer subunit beta